MVGGIYFKHNELKHAILSVCSRGWVTSEAIIADIRTIDKYKDYDKRKMLPRLNVLSMKRIERPDGKKGRGYTRRYLRYRILEQTHKNGVHIREYTLTKKGKRMLCEFNWREFYGVSLKWDGMSYRPYGCNNECSICKRV